MPVSRNRCKWSRCPGSRRSTSSAQPDAAVDIRCGGSCPRHHKWSRFHVPRKAGSPRRMVGVVAGAPRPGRAVAPGQTNPRGPPGNRPAGYDAKVSPGA